MRIEDSIDIAAPVSRVWELTLGIESWPEHTPTVTRVERLDSGPIEVGSQARLSQPQQPDRVWTVTDLEPEKLFAWSTRAMGTTMKAIHRLRPTESGTANTLAIELAGPLSSLVGMAIRRPLRAALVTENRGFKTAAEG
jgi:hypothetical protein